MGDEFSVKRGRNNPWLVSTIVLSILVILLVTGNIFGVTGKAVSTANIGKLAENFVANKLQVPGTVESVEKVSGVYQVNMKVQGQTVPLFFTKDGNWIAQGSGLLPLVEDNSQDINTDTNAEPAAQDVPKTDKPSVKAFIFSYCPYGLQFEKALFPVYDLLKNNADIEIVAIGAMHGEFEKTETLRQISIEQIYGKDKLFAYLKEFDANSDIGSCKGDDTCLNKYLPAIFTKLGISETKVNDYMKSNAEKIYTQQGSEANSLGISGSPTFVINGVKVSVSRTPEAIKEAVCSAFNTAPEACNQALSSSSTSPGFGASSSGSATTGAQCN